MYFINNKTMFQCTLEHTQEEFKNTMDPTDLIDDINEFIKDGSPLIRIGAKSEALKNLIENREQIVTKEYTSEMHLSDILFDEVTNNIITITNIKSYKKAINLINEIIDEIEELFYGALLIDNDKNIINPFHPVTAMLLSDKDKYPEWHNQEYKVVIYIYSTQESLDKCKKEYQSETADLELIENNINNIIKLSSSQIHSDIKVINASFNNGLANIEYKVKKDKSEDPSYELYLSAHQILTKSIVMPYYGTSVIKLNGETSGQHITPMISCNIAWSKYNKDWHSVCTGNLSNSTLKGLRTLNHANLLSPYNEKIIASGALEYAKMCIKKSLEIYKIAEILEEKQDEKKTNN